MCLEIYQLVPGKFFKKAVSKKPNVKVELLTDTDMQ